MDIRLQGREQRVAADDAGSAWAGGWHAELRLGFDRPLGGQATRLHRREHRGPLRVQRAFHPEGPDICQVIVLHPPGGIAGGDALTIAAELGPGATAQFTTPGAGKWYKAGGRAASQSLEFRIGSDGWMEWLPQENVVFDGAQARMETRVELAAGARYVGWDVVCLGRMASGERFAQGRLELRTGIWRDGRPLWIEQGGFEAGGAFMESAPGLGGHTVFATLVLAGAPISRDLVAACRAVAVPTSVRLAVTALPEVLLVRALGHATEPVRRALDSCWRAARPEFLGRAAVPPRIWNT
jgi:urease accessory protein